MLGSPITIPDIPTTSTIEVTVYSKLLYKDGEYWKWLARLLYSSPLLLFIMNIFITAVTASAVVAALAGITAITPVFAQQDPNSHGLEVSGVAEGHGLEVSSLTDLEGRLPGGGCIVQQQAQFQGKVVSEVASDFEIGTTD